MKKIIGLLLFIPALCFCVASSPVTLSVTNGTSITGKLTAYSPKTGIVKVREPAGSTQHAFSVFTPESQAQIEHWLSDKNFNLQSNLEVTFDYRSRHSTSNLVGTITDALTKSEREGTYGTEKTTFRTYHITLNNKSNTPFEDLAIDYRIFYTQQLTDEYTGHYQLAGSLQCETIKPDDTFELKTNPFISSIEYKSAPTIQWTGRPRSIYCNVQGIWLRIRKPGHTGEWVERKIKHGDVPSKRNRSDYQKVYK